MEKKHVVSDRIYDEFEPIVRWTSDPGFDTLMVYLPGFKKEQLKVQVTSARKLRVMGERPAGGNKWVRFHKEFPIQSNLDVDAISAKFEGVNLFVKLPKVELKRKQSPSRDGAAKPPVHEAGTKSPTQQLSKPAQKEEAKKVQEQSKLPTKKLGMKEAPMEKPDSKEEAPGTAEKVQRPKPAIEKRAGREDKTEQRAEREETSRYAETIKDKERPNDKILGPCCEVRGYKNVLRRYLREMKNNKRAMSLGFVLVASMVAFCLGIYADKKLRCSFGC